MVRLQSGVLIVRGFECVDRRVVRRGIVTWDGPRGPAAYIVVRSILAGCFIETVAGGFEEDVLSLKEGEVVVDRYNYR